MTKRENLVISWAAAARPADGCREIGDMYLFRRFSTGFLAAVVDGLGHGEEAAFASKVVINTLKNNYKLPLPSLINLCHQELIKTRGAVMSLAIYDKERKVLSWTGIGNVEGRLIHLKDDKDDKDRNVSGMTDYESLFLRSGVIGYRLPPTIRVAEIEINAESMLIFTTDGIRSGFTQDINSGLSVKEIAENVLNQNYKNNDDALVMIVDWRQDG